MLYNELGKTGINVSRVGCGGIPVQRVDLSTAHDLINKLIERGVNFIDSARGYTVSESMFGECLKGVRNKFFLATKSMARTYEGMKADIQTSLNNFKTDYIDLYQLHNLRGECDYSGALRALKEAKEQGIIKHIGVTSHSYDFLYKLLTDKLEGYDDIETIQFPYNFIESKSKDLFALAKKNGKGTIVMKPLAGGNIDNAQVAIKYLLNDENVDVIIPGMDSVTQIEENTLVCDNFIITEDEEKYISDTVLKLGNDFCRRCGYCQPCTKGIDIASCFTFENYYLHYNLQSWAIDRYNNLKVKPSECIECRDCESRCPYQLPIVEKLKRVVKNLGGK